MTNIADTLRAESETTLRAVLDSLEQKIGPQKFNAWFKHCAQITLEDGHVKVAVPNPFVANWVETHFQGQIAEAIRESLGRPHPVIVTIDSSLSGEIRKRQLDAQADLVAKANDGRERPRHLPPPCSLRYNLKEFVVGESNKLAYSAALAVASGDATFNPLFVYGPCGVGKTHLLQGICEYASRAMRNGRPLAWRYVPGEAFTNDFITSLRGKRLDEFRARYRKLDLLAIDDVHFLSAKKATQDEFLHTFNTIQSAGSQVVMASDAHPRMVGELNEQLTSRFMAGMVVKIEAPDEAMRAELIRRRCAALRLELPREVLQFVAAHLRGSVRELEGTLVKLAALSELEHGDVTLEMAREALADHMARTDSAVTLGGIEAVVAAFFGLTPADIHSSRRTRTVSLARMICIYLARQRTRMSYPEIGQFMGKNHSSVIQATQRLDSLLATGGDVEWMSPVGRKAMPASKVLEMLSEQVR